MAMARARRGRRPVPALAVTAAPIFEPASGVIAADDCLDVLRHTPGVEVRERTRVVRRGGRGQAASVSSSNRRRRWRNCGPRRVVVCAGPWTGPLGLGPRRRAAGPAHPGAGGLSGAGGRAGRRHPGVRRAPAARGSTACRSRRAGLMKISLHGAGPAVLAGGPRRRGRRPGATTDALAGRAAVLGPAGPAGARARTGGHRTVCLRQFPRRRFRGRPGRGASSSARVPRATASSSRRSRRAAGRPGHRCAAPRGTGVPQRSRTLRVGSAGSARRRVDRIIHPTLYYLTESAG